MIQQKILLLASFVNEENLEGFLQKIKNKFGVKKEHVFFFKTNEEFVLTYKIKLNPDKKIDIKKELPKTIQVHKKGDTIFTINALNRLVELESGLEGNVNHRDYQIDWEKFKNKIIILKDNILQVTDIERVLLS